MTKPDVNHFLVVFAACIAALGFGLFWIFYAIYRWQESIWRRERPAESRGFAVNVEEKGPNDLSSETDMKT